MHLTKEKIKEKDQAVKALEEKRFFKLVCGASLTDVEMIENLSFVFTLAGAHVIDLAPKADVIFAARRGIERAEERNGETASRRAGERTLRRSADPPTRRSVPLLMASIQLDQDPHFRKVEVDYNLCDLCGACVKICPTEAFRIESTNCEVRSMNSEPQTSNLETRTSNFEPRTFQYASERCFGCGVCPSYCHVNALNMIDAKPTPKETLQEMISLGIKSIEFHFGKNYEKVAQIWPDVKDLVNNFEIISFSIGSDLLSSKEIKKGANLCYKLAGEGIILQCDGTPMSGGFDKSLKNGNNKDSSSFEVARIIQEENLPVFLQISGGTNQYSFAKAIDLGLDISGVAIGSHARKLLMPYLTGKENLDDAINIAKSLVDSVGVYGRKK